jgi:uncharacterized protein YecT (DUF1311 family)
MTRRSVWNKACAMASLIGSAVLLAPPATAQDDFAFSPDATENCLSALVEGDDPRACFGRAAEACMQANEGGDTTVGTSACLGRELDWWDGRLNAAFVRLKEATAAFDADMAELGSAAESQTDALVAMQRAWMGFRDAACSFEATKWGGGTGGGPAYAACALALTAEQALRLEADLGDGS